MGTAVRLPSGPRRQATCSSHLASIAGCDPARIGASRNPVVPASSNPVKGVVPVVQRTCARQEIDVLRSVGVAHDAARCGVEDRIGARAIEMNLRFPTLEHRSVRNVNGRGHRISPRREIDLGPMDGSANRRRKREIGTTGNDAFRAVVCASALPPRRTSGADPAQMWATASTQSRTQPNLY
jgi:hypothetical protein